MTKTSPFQAKTLKTRKITMCESGVFGIADNSPAHFEGEFCYQKTSGIKGAILLKYSSGHDYPISAIVCADCAATWLAEDIKEGLKTNEGSK